MLDLVRKELAKATVEPGASDWLPAVKRALPTAEISFSGKDKHVVHIEVPNIQGFGVFVWMTDLSGFVELKSDTYRLKLTPTNAAQTVIKAYKAAAAIAEATVAWKREINARAADINALLEADRTFGDSFCQTLSRL